MKIWEIIGESVEPEMGKNYKKASGRVDLFTDPDQWDRTHHLDRVMRAAAQADGKGGKIEVNNNGWAGKYNTAHPYSPQEEDMMDEVYAALGTTVKRAVVDSHRTEREDVHKISPIRDRGHIKLIPPIDKKE